MATSNAPTTHTSGKTDVTACRFFYRGVVTSQIKDTITKILVLVMTRQPKMFACAGNVTRM